MIRKFFEWINWCAKKEQILIEQLDKHYLVIEALEQLSNETKNSIDNFVINYLKKKIQENKLQGKKI